MIPTTTTEPPAGGGPASDPAAPRQRDAERSRAAILDAAERLFAAQGLEGTSMQAIGAAAGVSRGLPGYLFGSKERLYRATLARLIQAEHAAVAEAQAQSAEGGGTVAVLTAAIRSHLRFLQARPAFLRLVAREALRGGDDLRGAEGYLAVLQAGRAIIEGEQARGNLRNEPAERILMHALALCWFPFSHADTVARGLGVDPSAPEFPDQHAEAVVRLLLEGVSGFG